MYIYMYMYIYIYIYIYIFSEKHFLLAFVHQNIPFLLSHKGYCPEVSLLLRMLLHTHFLKVSGNGLQHDLKR